MKRFPIPILAATVLWAIALMTGCQGNDNGGQPGEDSSEILQAGQFLSDSLRVGMTLPPSPGWSLRLDPHIRGGSYVTAYHEGETASVRLFVTPSDQVQDLESLFKRRQDQIAGLFGASNLDQVVERVIGKDQQEVLGHTAMRWQAVTEPVDVAGEDPVRVVFMWVMTVRPEFAYECVGLARVPVDPTPEQRAAGEGLINDMAFILDSLEFR